MAGNIATTGQVMQVAKIKRSHVFGASGSGATTLAKAISETFGYHFIDTDDIFWEQTDPPFTKRRPAALALKGLQKAIALNEHVVISGAFVGWGDSVKPAIDLFVFLHLPLSIRLERIKKREYHRFGARVLAGGDLYEQHLSFLEWVSAYEIGDVNMRSKRQHETWLADVKVPIIRITEPLPLTDMIKLIEPHLGR